MRHGWLNGLGFGGGARHYSEQSGDPQHTFSIPAYGLVEAAIFYRRGHFHWQFNASNLANKRYYTGSYNDLYVQPGSPRSVRTTLTWTLGDMTPTR
jgi:iron complex outermembrane recepter protein